MQGITQPAGELNLRVIPRRVHPGRELSFREIVEHGYPHRDQPAHIREWKQRNLKHLAPAVARFVPARAVARKAGLPYLWSQLFLRKIHRDGTIDNLGLAGIKVVTTVGAGFIVDAFQNTVELETMKYHGVGETNTAEDASDTDLVAELTTEYTTNSTRATGTTTEGASANIYETVATNSFDAAVALVEHGIFSDAAVGSGVLLDRTVFAVVNLGSGESLESTYDFTVTAGG